jgi:uncharacterized damage-inducible protein DinB
MTHLETFRDLYRHMEWADAAAWSAVVASDAACADKSTRERLFHIHQVQRLFLAVWRSQPLDPHAGEGLETRDLARWARSYYSEAQSFLAGIGDSELEASVSLPWTPLVAERLGFEPAPIKLRDTVIQVYTHTAHHRGQVISRLRELGAEPPLIDFIAWVWRGRPEPAWP